MKRAHENDERENRLVRYNEARENRRKWEKFDAMRDATYKPENAPFSCRQLVQVWLLFASLDTLVDDIKQNVRELIVQSSLRDVKFQSFMFGNMRDKGTYKISLYEPIVWLLRFTVDKDGDTDEDLLRGDITIGDDMIIKHRVSWKHIRSSSWPALETIAAIERAELWSSLADHHLDPLEIHFHEF